MKEIKFGERNLLNGNEAAATAVLLCKPKVIAVYPITPQTACVELLSEFKANNMLDAEIVHVESEHSAISVCVGAEATGVRTFTATSSQGLALMHEILFIASGMRLPIVMGIANRALSAPINIWNDESDSLAQRDSGWLQFYCSSVQEVFDSIIQAYRVSEARDVLLPSMVCYDGFLISHFYEPIHVPTQDEVDNFLPEYEPIFRLDKGGKITMGPVGRPEHYMEFKKHQADAMERAKQRIIEVNKDFAQRFGRSYGDGLIEEYNIEGAKRVVVAMGSIASNFKYYIEKHDKDLGLLRIRSFRPFPKDEVRKILERFDEIGVVDRAYSFGSGGPLFTEIKGILAKDRKLNNFIVSLGGRKLRVEDIKFVAKHAGKDEKIYWINVFGGRNVVEGGKSGGK